MDDCFLIVYSGFKLVTVRHKSYWYFGSVINIKLQFEISDLTKS